MFDVKREGFPQLEAKIAEYHTQIRNLHDQVPQQMLAWQREDMRRSNPNLSIESTPASTAATTLIWPRSRLSDQAGNKRRGPRRHQPKQYLPANAGPGMQSRRPILRAELLEKLFDRMRALAAKAMKWP
jgi:hypothetical protein